MPVAHTADGFVQTPEWLTRQMVTQLFASDAPSADDHLIDPGCGEGDFIAAVLSHCKTAGIAPPQITGVELDPERAVFAKARFSAAANVTIRMADYLRDDSLAAADYVLGNPPYVSLTNIAVEDRVNLKQRFQTATGRFDLYMLFFERSLRLLKPGGRLSMVTPEKWLYVASAGRLRTLLAANAIERLTFLSEDSFPGFVTYPLVTQVHKTNEVGETQIVLRDGANSTVQLSRTPEAWPSFRGHAAATSETNSDATLSDLCTRIGCGPATGKDDVFVVDLDAVTKELAPLPDRPCLGVNSTAIVRHSRRKLFSYPTAGRVNCCPLRHWHRSSIISPATASNSKHVAAPRASAGMPTMRRRPCANSFALNSSARTSRKTLNFTSIAAARSCRGTASTTSSRSLTSR